MPLHTLILLGDSLPGFEQQALRKIKTPLGTVVAYRRSMSQDCSCVEFGVGYRSTVVPGLFKGELEPQEGKARWAVEPIADPVVRSELVALLKARGYPKPIEFWD